MISKISYVILWLWKAKKIVLSPVNAFQFISSRTDSNYVGIFRYPGGRFMCRKQDWLGIREIFLDNEYSSIISCIRDSSAPVIVDLGANIGGFALFIFSHYPDAKVLSVEAAPDTFEMLIKNQSMNPNRKWDVVHAAVWMETGPIYLDRRSESTGHCVVDNDSSGEAIPGRSLDELIAEAGIKEIDVLKMDIEGAEERVIPVSKKILQATKILIIEVHTDRIDPLQVYRILAECFSYCWLVEQRESEKPVFILSREELSITDATPMGIGDMQQGS